MKALESRLYVAGHCLNFAAATYKGDPWRIERYPAICALIKHPERGYIVFDTGYSRAFKEQTRRFPYCLYPLATPVRLAEGESLSEQLKTDGVDPREIGTVILSHFHADHMAGLADFPHAKIIADTGGYAALRNLKGFAAVRQGFIPGLVPEDFEKRHSGIFHRRRVNLDASMAPFKYGYDLLGDGSLLAIYLHGHAFGQFGLYFKDSRRGPTFLCADAAWSRKAIRQNVGPGRLGYMAVDDRSACDDNLDKLHQLHQANPDLRIVPSHCQEVWAEIKEGLR